MRRPRVRFSVRRLMAAMAIVALGLTVLMRRPCPIGGLSMFGLGVVYWSDGSTTKGALPAPERYREYGPLLRVEWSDGSVSWYLGRSAPTGPATRRELAVRCTRVLAGGGPDPPRCTAAGWLALNAAGIDPGVAVPALAVAARDPSRSVRFSAVCALWNFVTRSPDAVEAVAGALRDEHAVIRVAAAAALGSVSPGSEPAKDMAVPALTHALENANASVRRQAAQALVALQEVDAADPAVREALGGLDR